MTQRLFLLRHGEVTSHRGDVPVTEEGLQTALEVGRRLAGRAEGAIRVISGETRRTRDTAAAVARGAREAGAEVLEEGVAFALRNPDLYLGGVRVDMVSSETAFAAQVPGLGEADIARIDFYREWLAAPDRVGWWVAHKNPPGDDAAAVAARIRTFAASLADRQDTTAFTVGITHSPVLRAVACDVTGADSGEPAWLAGLETTISSDRSVEIRVLPDAPGAEEST
jgi:broad specificity phosphatase PhoE